MDRTGLLIALGIVVVVGLLFALYPGLDLVFSAPFAVREPNGEWFFSAYADFWRRIAKYLVALVAAPTVVALFLKLLQPKRPLILPGRAIVLMLVTLLLGPGLVVENVLKDHSGRTRPVYVTAFGGTERFVPLWDFDGPCQTNCSFVAGEPAAAFWTLAAAAVTPPPWRTAAYVAAITFGVVVGLLRMAVGAHFFTDVVFAGIITFLIIWLVHGLLYRWAATRMTDEAIERAIERMATPLHDGLRQIAARFRRLAVNSKDGDLP